MGSLIDMVDLPGNRLATVAEEADFAVLPVGALEWHGPHLPLGTDLQLATGFAAELARSDWTAALFPAVAYTACPGQTRHWPGTVWVRPETTVSMLGDVLAGIVRAGFARVLVVNGHDANASTVRAAMEWVSGTVRASFLLCNWFQLLTRAETDRLFGRDVVARGHGGAYETAALIGVGGTVDLDSASDLPPRPPLDTPHPHALVESRPHPFDGWSGHVSRVDDASAAKIRTIAGERLRELVAAWLASPLPDPPGGPSPRG